MTCRARSKYSPERRVRSSSVARSRSVRVATWGKGAVVRAMTAIVRVGEAVYPVRSAARRTLPLAVLGSSSAKSTSRGYLYGAVRALTCSWSSRASASDGAYDAAALLVRRRHDRGLGDRRVGHQRGLDLERPDPVAGRDDHVVEAALEVQEAVVV